MNNRKTYAVFGLGRYGTAVAEELAKSGAEVLGVDMNQEIINMQIGRADAAGMDLHQNITGAGCGLGPFLVMQIFRASGCFYQSIHHFRHDRLLSLLALRAAMADTP